MKERPIIFLTQMVQAILNGKKTQTRRVIKFKIWQDCLVIVMTEHFEPFKDSPPNEQFWSVDHQATGKILVEQNLRCPYGQVGDRLWIRETWRPIGGCQNGAIIEYKASYTKRNMHELEVYDYVRKVCSIPNHIDYTASLKWKPSIHMSHWTSRITLEITKIRVERLQDITSNDALSEGVNGKDPSDCVMNFGALWDSINEKRGHGWDKNPWVWVIEFKVIKEK